LFFQDGWLTTLYGRRQDETKKKPSPIIERKKKGKRAIIHKRVVHPEAMKPTKRGCRAVYGLWYAKTPPFRWAASEDA